MEIAPQTAGQEPSVRSFDPPDTKNTEDYHLLVNGLYEQTFTKTPFYVLPIALQHALTNQVVNKRVCQNRGGLGEIEINLRMPDVILVRRHHSHPAGTSVISS